MASACDTPPEGGGKSLFPRVNPTGGEDVGVMSFVGAATKKGRGAVEGFSSRN